MDEQVKAVVDGFRSLSEEQQADAYLEIDAIWKALRDNEPVDPDLASG